jgi:SDR family mycofactocin-dependent oxidoreductase
MGDLKGKVAFITGAGRGQGRAHAVRLAADGANIIAVDICADIATIPYSMSTTDDLEETRRLVEKEGRRASAQVADVRDPAALQAAFEAGLGDVGASRADIVIANAGGCAYPSDVDERDAFRDALDIMLVGVWNTVKVTAPPLVEGGQGGAIVLTSSTAAIRGFTGGWGGLDGYTAAKSGVLGLMRVFANSLAPHNIRVNCIHPTGVNTGMVQNAAFMQWATEAVANPIANMSNKLPDVTVIDPFDVANAVAWLVSDEARYVTGVSLPVDAGFCNA